MTRWARLRRRLLALLGVGALVLLLLKLRRRIKQADNQRDPEQMENTETHSSTDDKTARARERPPSHSGPAPDPVRRDTPADPPPQQPLQRRRSGEAVVDDTRWQLKGEFAAFCSHYKRECAMEARHCQFDLEQMLGAPCFLDSDDLTDLRKLLQHVAHSDVLLLFQSANVLTRPFCLLELNAAIAAKVPIIAINVRGGNEYSFDDSMHFLRYLDVELEQRNPDAGKLLTKHGVDITHLAYTLSMVVPSLISIDFNPSGSRNALRASLLDIIKAMRTAEPFLFDAADQTKEEWLTVRGDPRAPGRPRTALHEHGKSESGGSTLALVPPEVPMLPESAVDRPDLMDALKQQVLQQDASGGAKTTTVTAPPKKTGNATTTIGMGGVGARAAHSMSPPCLSF